MVHEKFFVSQRAVETDRMKDTKRFLMRKGWHVREKVVENAASQTKMLRQGTALVDGQRRIKWIDRLSPTIYMWMIGRDIICKRGSFKDIREITPKNLILRGIIQFETGCAK